MKIGIVCYPTFGGSGVLATELGLGTLNTQRLNQWVVVKLWFLLCIHFSSVILSSILMCVVWYHIISNHKRANSSLSSACKNNGKWQHAEAPIMPPLFEQNDMSNHAIDIPHIFNLICTLLTMACGGPICTLLTTLWSVGIHPFDKHSTPLLLM